MKWILIVYVSGVIGSFIGLQIEELKDNSRKRYLSIDRQNWLKKNLFKRLFVNLLFSLAWPMYVITIIDSLIYIHRRERPKKDIDT